MGRTAPESSTPARVTRSKRARDEASSSNEAAPQEPDSGVGFVIDKVGRVTRSQQATAASKASAAQKAEKKVTKAAKQQRGDEEGGQDTVDPPAKMPRLGLDVPIPSDLPQSKRRKIRQRLKKSVNAARDLKKVATDEAKAEAKASAKAATALSSRVSKHPDLEPAAPASAPKIVGAVPPIFQTSRFLEAKYDLWGPAPAPSKSKEASDGPEYNVDDLVNRPPKKHDRTLNARGLRKVPLVPDPGLSYNPDEEDHSQLLQKARRFVAQQEAEKAAVDLKLSGQGPYFEFQPVVSKDRDDEVPRPRPRPPVSGSKRTRQEIKRQLRHRRLMQRQLQRRHNKLRNRELALAPQIAREVDLELELKRLRREQRAAEREAREAELGAKLPRLGRYALKATCPDVVEPDRLTGVMRSAPNLGNLATDLFARIQARGMMAPVRMNAGQRAGVRRLPSRLKFRMVKAYKD